MTNDDPLPTPEHRRPESASEREQIVWALAYLRRLLGEGFVDWVLAEPNTTLSEKQKEVAIALAHTLDEYLTKYSDIGFIGSLFASYQRAYETTFINHCRRWAGGTIKVIDERSDDKLLSAFLAFANECYGELLLPDRPLGGIPDFFHYVETPAGQKLVQALRNEGILPLGIEDDHRTPDESGVSNYRRSLAPGTFASSLIWCAWKLAKLDKGNPTPAQLAAKIPIALGQLRSSFSGLPTAVAAVASLSGIRLPEGAEISGSWGRIRPARPEDHPASFRELVNIRTTTTTGAGESIEISDAGDVIFETMIRIKVEINDEKTGWSSQGLDDFGDMIDRVRLALALALRRSTRPTVFYTWAATLLPMGYAEPFPTIDFRSMEGRTPVLLTTDEMAAWEHWIDIVTMTDMSRLKVAMTRTLRAMTERQDPSDRLIDAVIAWESLFGAVNESTLRVTASLARLLHPIEDREAARKFYGKIYQARSDIVHANETQTTVGQIDEYGKAAINASLNTIGKLLTTHSALLALKSSTRSTRVILSTEGAGTSQGSA